MPRLQNSATKVIVNVDADTAREMLSGTTEWAAIRRPKADSKAETE